MRICEGDDVLNSLFNPILLFVEYFVYKRSVVQTNRTFCGIVIINNMNEMFKQGLIATLSGYHVMKIIVQHVSYNPKTCLEKSWKSHGI